MNGQIVLASANGSLLAMPSITNCVCFKHSLEMLKRLGGRLFAFRPTCLWYLVVSVVKVFTKIDKCRFKSSSFSAFLRCARISRFSSKVSRSWLLTSITLHKTIAVAIKRRVGIAIYQLDHLSRITYTEWWYVLYTLRQHLSQCKPEILTFHQVQDIMLSFRLGKQTSAT